MEKDSFLDSNVIINYVNYQKDKSSEIVNKCYLYIVNKQGRFIVCYAVIRELLNIVTKLAALHREVLTKIEDNNYVIDNSGHLSKRDLPLAEKLYLAHKGISGKELRKIFALERDIFEIEIEKFLKNKVDIKVIPLEEIKIELVNTLRDIIDNYADCRILASAIQHQQNEKTFLLVTADKKDLNQNHYECIKDYSILKDYKLPELLNLMS